MHVSSNNNKLRNSSGWTRIWRRQRHSFVTLHSNRYRRCTYFSHLFNLLCCCFQPRFVNIQENIIFPLNIIISSDFQDFKNFSIQKAIKSIIKVHWAQQYLVKVDQIVNLIFWFWYLIQILCGNLYGFCVRLLIRFCPAPKRREETEHKYIPRTESYLALSGTTLGFMFSEHFYLKAVPVNPPYDKFQTNFSHKIW